jgi:hypothetical protein
MIFLSNKTKDQFNERLIKMSKNKAKSQFKDEEYLMKIKELQRKIVEQEITINTLNTARNNDQSEKIKVRFCLTLKYII